MARSPANVDVLVVAHVDEEIECERHCDDGGDSEKCPRALSDGQQSTRSAEDEHRSEAEEERHPRVPDRDRVDEHLEQRAG